MRGSGWIPAIAAALLCLAACVWPAIALVLNVDFAPSSNDPNVEMSDAGSLFMRSIVWSIAIACAASLLGWLPGRLLAASAGKRSFVIFAALLAIPVCLPEYVVYWCWWQGIPPGSFVHDWFNQLNAIPQMRATILAAALICWSWPIVSWCVAGASLNQPEHGEDLLRLTGQPWWKRALLRFRYDARGVILGGLFIAIATFANTTSFDLAQIYTFGNELRAREALGATPRQLLATGFPAVIVTTIAAAFLWYLFSKPRQQRASMTIHASRGTTIYTIALWTFSIIVPIALLFTGAAAMLKHAGGNPFAQFFSYYSSGLFNTVGMALVSASLAAVLAVAFTMMWLDHRPWLRTLAHVQALIWLIIAAAPSTIAGLALEAAYNHPGVADSLIYKTPIVLALAHLTRFAFVGVIIGRWLAMNEPAEMRDLRRLDDAGTVISFVRTSGPRLIAALVATFAITAVLSAGEITVTNFIRPVGFDVLAPSVLNAMHYQQMDTVLVAVFVQLALSILAALLVAVTLRLARNRTLARRGTINSISTVVLLALLAIAPGCSSQSGDAKPLDTEETFGAPGQALGQFDYPRCISINRDTNKIYIVDKSARVQRFDSDGTPEIFWRMPAKDNGKPTGIDVSPDGRVFVADTHYYRVIVYDADGNELMHIGEYGNGPGQFVYVTDIAFGPDEKLYISEYGGNDRIQVFDRDGTYEFGFSAFGDKPGELNRPQSIVFNADKSRLYVADACNHRISVFTPKGEFITSFGEMGRERGQMAYPYGLIVLPDETLLVTEFGNHRIQQFTQDGKSLGMWGRLGTHEGELQYPWGADTDGEKLFVLDSGNNRVQVMDLP